MYCKLSIILLILFLMAPGAIGFVDDARSFALEAAAPYVQKGFAVREEFWSGELQVNREKLIVHQLFRGNEYWFWFATDVERARLTVHIYDAKGKLVESESWFKPVPGGAVAAAHVKPSYSGAFYLVLEIKDSPKPLTHWSLAYAFR